MAKKVTIDVEARFIDNMTDDAKAASKAFDGIEKGAEKAQKEVDKLNKKKAKPSLDADDSKILKILKDNDKKLKKFGRTKTETTLGAKDKATSVITKALDKAKNFGGKTYRAILKIRDSDALTTLNKVSSGLKTITGKTWSTMLKIKDYATAPLRTIKNMLFSIQSLVMAITAGVAAKQFIINPINLADAYSSAKIGFSTLLGEDEGQAMMDRIDAFAKATPFKTSGVISNVQKMMAYGWDVNRVIEDMETIGNAAASTGKGDEGLSSIVYALSEIRSKGKLSTQELNQLASAGIKAKQYLAQGLGFGTDDAGLMKLSEALEDGAVGANQAIDLILQGMKEFDGMMDQTANETVTGLWSQIEDTFEINIFRKWGQGLQDGAKRGIGSLVSLLDKSEGALQELGNTLYELGKSISNYLADILKDTVSRIQKITDSKEFKNASLGKKIKMLWEGAIANPFSEWWSKTVVPWWDHTAIPWLKEKAASAGKAIGKGLSNILLTLLGKDTAGAVEEGVSIGSSFVKGFLEGFDGAAIADAFVDAFGRIWDAMPWWAKALLFGYGASKIGGMINGIFSFLGNTKMFLGSPSSGTGLLGFGANAAINMGAGNLAGGASMSNGALSALGLSSTAGFITGGITAIDGVTDLYDGFKNNDSTAVQTGAWKTGGALGGAGLGAAIGSIIPGVGTAIGAGVGALFGSIVGWIGASNVEKEAEEAARKAEEEAREAAKKEAELAAAIQKGLVDHFGDISMSMEEINTSLSEMFGRDVIARANAATEAISQMNSSLEAFTSADYNLKKGLWMTTLKKGASLTSDEISGLQSSVDDFTSAAASYVDDAQYASHESIVALMGDSDMTKKVIEKSTAYYDEKSKKLSGLTEDLDKALSDALADNVISIDEEKSIQNLRAQITNVMAQIKQDQYTADMNIIKAKYSNTDMTYDSFATMMEQSAASAQEMTDGFWQQFGQGSIGLEEGSEEWNALLKSTLDNISGVLQTAGDLGLDKLQANWKDELGIFGQDIADVLQNNTLSDIKDAALSMTDETRGEIGKVLEAMQPTTEQIQVLADSYEQAGMAVPEALASYLDTVEFYEALAGGVETVEQYFRDHEIDIDPKISYDNIKDKLHAGDWEGIDAFELSLDAHADIAWTYDPFDDEWITPDGSYGFTTEALVEAGWTYNEFDKKWISPDGQYSFNTDVNVNAKYNVKKFTGFRSDFGISATYEFKQQVLIDQIYGEKYRGGIVGGSSAMEAFARGGETDNSGIVGGSTRFIRVNEESPEMIIPLSSQRRERALKLFAKTGELLDVPGFARGGNTRGSRDEGLRFYNYGGNDAPGGQSVLVEVGGIQIEIHVDGNDKEGIAQAIKDQVGDIADYVVGRIADELARQFENTPVRGGAA